MPDELLRITAECHAGYRGEETPRAFTMGDRRVAIARIVDRWLAPDHRYFKVEDHDQHVYIIRHATRDDGWELTMFQRGAGSAARPPRAADTGFP